MVAKQWRRCALGDLGPGGHTTFWPGAIHLIFLGVQGQPTNLLVLLGILVGCYQFHTGSGAIVLTATGILHCVLAKVSGSRRYVWSGWNFRGYVRWKYRWFQLIFTMALDPSVQTQVRRMWNEYTRRLEFLANIWPKEHLPLLAPRRLHVV